MRGLLLAAMLLSSWVAGAQGAGTAASSSPTPNPTPSSSGTSPAAATSPSATEGKASSSPSPSGSPQKFQPILAEQQTGYIVFESGEDLSSASLGKTWKEFCDRLGKGLLITAPVPGFLASYSCLPLGVKEQPSRPPLWRIRLAEQKRFFEVEVSHFQRPEGYRKIRSFSFRFEGNLMSSLTGETLPLLMARMLAESLPLGWSFLYEANQKEFSFKLPKDLPALPAELLLYELAFDPKRKLWIPTVRGTLTQTASKKFDLTKRQDTYVVGQTFAPLKDKQRYWVQNAQGLSKQQAEYEKALSAQLKGLSFMTLLDRLIFDSFESNYGGFRYGKSFLIGSSVVTEADLLSILVEMRSGLFAGLRWYYDLSPEVRRGVDGEEEFFKMSRISLGWAFDFEMPAPISFLVSRVEVQPKFGLLDVQTKFSILDDENNKTALNFDAKNAYDLAIELGVEKESYWFRSRLWTAFSAAMFGLSNKSNTSVVSSKAGLDAYWDLFEWGSLDLNLLTFVLAERLSLSKDGGQLEEEADIGIAEVGFSLFFVGGGFTLSW